LSCCGNRDWNEDCDCECHWDRENECHCDCDNNPLTNQLTSLDVSENTALTVLDCYGNRLTDIALNRLFDTLPYKGGAIIIGENPGTDSCSASIARDKGWDVYNAYVDIFRFVDLGDGFYA